MSISSNRNSFQATRVESVSLTQAGYISWSAHPSLSSFPRCLTSAVWAVSGRAGGITRSGDVDPFHADASFFLSSSPHSSSLFFLLAAVPDAALGRVLEGALQARLVKRDLQLWRKKKKKQVTFWVCRVWDRAQ